jgi:serine/threonine protein kinase
MLMIPERWQQVKAVLEQALDLAPEQRKGFLDDACQDDQALRQEVDSLLQEENEDADGPLQSPVNVSMKDVAREAECWAGHRIGSYEIIELIGEGGMGSLFRAARADEQYKKQVAIKIVKQGLTTPFALARFRAERQILANLEHPNIARLLDGGTSENGVPYVVMEFVEGRPIDAFCDDHKLTIDARLQIFLEVCSAVQYAHRRLIVHRDLKPNNILVTREGAPKLIDFGIAKILDPEASDGIDQGTTGLRILTPAYASPEQVKGEPITTASDVYSLGVVLYELLTGHPPYRVALRTPETLARAACEQEPEKPSLAVRRTASTEEGRKEVTPETISASRRSRQEKLSAQLGGDLDNITLMALRKEPERRYGSVEQFAEDIRRHLENLPVSAHGDSLHYRARKFATRHRAGISAAAVAGLALIMGTAVSLREAHVARAERARAEKRFNDVRRLANSLIFEIHDSVSAVPGTTATRKLIVERGLEYLDSLSQESTADTSLMAELASAYGRIGEAQGGQFAANLGDTTGALRSFQKALEIRKQIYVAGPQSVDNIIALANSYCAVSEKLLSSGRTAEAYQDVQQAVALGEKALLSHPQDARVVQELASDYDAEADILGGNFNLSNLGDRNAALAARRKNMEVTERLAKLRPGDESAQRSMGAAVVRMGDQLLLSGQRQASLQQYLAAQSLLANLVTHSPTPKLQDNLHGVYQRISVVRMANGEYAEAVKAARETLALSSRLTAADPRDEWAQLSLADDYSNLADAVSRTANWQEAISAANRSLSIMSALLAHDTNNVEVQGVQSAALNTAGAVYQRAGNEKVALSYYRKSLEITARIYGGDPKNEDARLRLAADYNSIASAFLGLGDAGGAAKAYEEAMTLATISDSASPSEEALYVIANSYAGQGDAQMKLAEKERQSGRKLPLLQKACGLFDQSLKVWGAIREPGTMSPNGFYSVAPAAVAAQLMSCRSAVQDF